KAEEFFMVSSTITKEYQRVICERKGASGEALWLTLNNEAMRNSLDDVMQRELLEILEMVALDYSIRCVVIGAAGEKAFCSGGDIRAFQSMSLVSGYE